MQRCSSASSKSSSGSVRKANNSGEVSAGGDECNEGLLTPASRGGNCAICLSPLKKSGGNDDREVYTVKLCRVRQIGDTAVVGSSLDYR